MYLHFLVTAIHSSQLSTLTSSIPSQYATRIDYKAESELMTTQAIDSTQKTRKRSATYQVSIDIKYFKQSSKTSGVKKITCKQQPKHFHYIQPSLVTMEFFDLKAQLGQVLQFCEPKHIINKCSSLLASESYNIPLFSSSYAEKLQEIEYTPKLIQTLSPFVTWDNHSILSTIADTSNIPEATMLLTQFDDRIDSSQPLTSYPIPVPSHHMVPYHNSTHTVLAVKLDLKLYHSTLQNVFEARSLIQEQCKLTSHCLQLLAVTKSDLTIYWTIPKNVSHHIASNALQFQNYYHQNGILELAVYPGAVFCTASTLKVGPLSFFSQIEVGGKMVRIISLLKYCYYCCCLQEAKNASDHLNTKLSELEVIHCTLLNYLCLLYEGHK